MPRDRLAKVKEKMLNEFVSSSDVDIDSINKKTLRSYIAGPISKIFGVSPDAMEIALSELENSK